MKKTHLIFIIIIVFLFIVAAQAFYTVDETESVLIIELGKPVRTVTDPGLHFKTPFIHQVITFDKRILVYDAAPSVIITKDKKNLVVDNYAKWQIIDPLKYYQTVRNEIGAQARLDDIVFSIVREELGKHNLADIVAKTRASLMETVTVKSNKAAFAYGVKVVDVRIKRAELPPENEKAVFARMRAEREREAKRYRSEGEEKALGIRAAADMEKTIILSEANMKSQVLKGEGDATATRIYAEAYRKDSKFFYFLKTMEAYGAVFGDKDTVVLTPDSEFFRYLKESK
ncbi:MAG: protease modulator HflC [Thermodesulfobacteriota bacterium]